jgi:hypothetical protein
MRDTPFGEVVRWTERDEPPPVGRHFHRSKKGLDTNTTDVTGYRTKLARVAALGWLATAGGDAPSL